MEPIIELIELTCTLVTLIRMTVVPNTSKVGPV